MKKTIVLGKTKSTFSPLPSELLKIEKHSFDCEWYWGFGYIGNANLHTHVEHTLLDHNFTNIADIFEKPNYTQKEWWVIRDLFIQAYRLKKCAEVYRHGGYQTSCDDTQIIVDKAMEKRINEDLEKVLDKLWSILEK